MRFWETAPTYRSPNPNFCPKLHVSVNVRLEVGRWVRRPQKVDCTLNTLKKIKEIKRLPARGSMAIP